MNRFWSVVLTLLNQLVPLPQCLVEDWRIRNRMQERAAVPLGDDKVYMTLELSDLKESHRAALALRDQLQRRAQGYLMAITVASSFTLGALALLVKVQSGEAAPVHLSGITRVILLTVLGSFTMSAVSALRVLGPSEVYDLWLRSQLPNDPEQRKANLIRFIQLNESYAMAYAYHTRGSYVGMRNGVVVLFTWFTMVITSPCLLL